MVSQEIFESSSCSNHHIIEDGHNPSDHLPICMTMRVKIQPSVKKQNESLSELTLKWSKVSDKDKVFNHETLENATSFLPPPLTCQLPCVGGCHCELELCHPVLQQEYDNLIAAIKKADSTLPRHRAGREKSWWSQELTNLKNQSIEIQKIWISEGRPGQGPTHLERLRVRAAYRRAIRNAQKAPKQASWNRLHTAMEHCDSNGFWHSWKSLYNKNNSGFAPMVDGCTSKTAIAESFKKAFQRNSQPNNVSKVEQLTSRFINQY